MDALLWGGLLLLGFVVAVSALLTLQVWLAGKPRFIYGLIQPLVWVAIAVAGRFYVPLTPDPLLEPGSYGTGAVALAVVSLVVFLAVRAVKRRKK